jgi:asparagine synthase (glutamine-hydrolysing)
MAAALRHRGPDGIGLYAGARVGLAHTRLSIIDPIGGVQPFESEDGQVVISYNGEVFNYLELRRELEDKGRRFRTRSDTEVLVHGYQEWGEALMHRLNGQFAFAIYDRHRERVLLARDRFGVHPLFYAVQSGSLYFASEVKALFATGEVHAAPDLVGLDEVFTFWGARAPRTPFRGVLSLEPGTFALWRDGKMRITRYYDLRFPEAAIEPDDALELLDGLMESSVRLRLRADVPVGGYLSGGIDSGIACALAAAASPHQLRTFSVTFADPTFDESAFQHLVAEQLRSRHAVVSIQPGDIAHLFPEVIWHAESPVVRTAPAPMYLLAKLTRESGIRVVLTGEGADELFLGYDLFKETVVRLFCLRQPGSALRPRLFDRLYPHLVERRHAGEFWRRSFLEAGGAEDPLFSHLPRFMMTARIKRFYSPDVRDALAGGNVLEELRQALPAEYACWSPVNRAAYLELTTLLPSYLLSAQGERMAMAHGIEARFPFLDHRLFEFAAMLPVRSKLHGLHDKAILRRWAEGVVPPAVRQRRKQPYSAPDAPSFFGAGEPEYVAALLDDASIRRTGIFDPHAVAGLLRRCRAGRVTSVAENQALVAVLSTQLWFHEFVHERHALSTAVAHTTSAFRPALTAPTDSPSLYFMEETA